MTSALLRRNRPGESIQQKTLFSNLQALFNLIIPINRSDQHDQKAPEFRITLAPQQTSTVLLVVVFPKLLSL
jgi:hypothetical protein